jgi:hypothetical protein
MDTEKLLENFQKYANLLEKYFPNPGTSKFLEDYGIRLTTAPRGLKDADGGAPGELINFLLRVTLTANDHSKAIEARVGSGSIDRKSIARICLIHELGKLGSPEEELFIVQESQWHKEKLGQNFKYNENCPKMSTSHRTLCLLQTYGINITANEWVAILTSQGMQYPENAFYGNSLPDIAKVLHFARSIADLENN